MLASLFEKPSVEVCLVSGVVFVGTMPLPFDLSRHVLLKWLDTQRERCTTFTWLFTTCVTDMNDIVEIQTFNKGLFVLKVLSCPEFCVYIRNLNEKTHFTTRGGTRLKPHEKEYPRFEFFRCRMMVYFWTTSRFYKIEWPQVCMREWLVTIPTSNR
jgi:hypothetical protein